MNLPMLQDLDRFLAVAEVTGDRFGQYGLPQCGLGRWAEARGLFRGLDVQCFGGLAYSRLCQALGTSCTKLAPVWDANDRSGGHPGVMRTALHRVFPEITTMPATPAHQEVGP